MAWKRIKPFNKLKKQTLRLRYIFKKPISQLILFIILTSTLFLSLVLEENSSGGAKQDYYFLRQFVLDFTDNFFNGLDKFINNSGSLIHSPFFYILISVFNKIFNNFFIFKIFYILISSSLVLIFYKILKDKYLGKNEYYFFFALIIFFSPYFRSSAVWGLGDNLSLIFFGLFVVYINKIIRGQNINKSFYYAAIFIILASYVRYYYCAYYLIIIYFFFINNLSKKKIFKILFASFLMALPAIIYFFIIFKNNNFFNVLSGFGGLNYLHVIFDICLIILFYLIIFLIKNFNDVFNYYKKNYILFITIFTISFIIITIDFYTFRIINIRYNFGGGVIAKLFYESKIDNYFLVFPFILTVLLIDYIFSGNRKFNYFIFFIVILSMPLNIIYQKYLDPLFLFILFGLIVSQKLNQIMNRQLIDIKYLYFYYILFLFSSNIYYSYP